MRKTHAPNDWPNAAEHRSLDAIYAKARREFGPGGLTRGAYTLRELMERTTYSRSQLMRAREALGQKWKRLGKGGDHIITEEQSEELTDWLRHDYWDKSQRLYCCLACQTDRRPAYGLGLCNRCYHRYRRTCIRLGLPTTPTDQRTLSVSLRKTLDRDKSGEDGRFLDEVVYSLDRGRALSTEQLEGLQRIRGES